MDIVIIGAQKSGTSWLFSMLRQHPMSATAHVKEVHYFDKAGSPPHCLEQLDAWRSTLWQRPGARNREYAEYLRFALSPALAFTDNWYKGIFDRKPMNRRKMAEYAEVFRLESSPAYCVMDERRIQHFRQLMPECVPVLVIRDPADRLISAVNMIVGLTHGADTWGVREQYAVLASEIAGRGEYSYAVPKWRKYFDNKLCLIPFGAIRRDPNWVLKKVERAAGLPPANYERMAKKRNSWTGQIDVSAEVRHKIDELVAPQYEYLEKEFGKDFLRDIV